MNRRNSLGLFIVAASGLALLPGSAVAQQKSLKEQLVGTWTVVSWDQVTKDGNKFQRFGANPKGVNVFDANGRFYIMFARPDLPNIAANDPMKSTPEENKAVMEGSIAYFGTYTVDETSKSASLRVEASTFPNQVGREQKRTIVSLTANELTLTNPTALTGGLITYVMKRATTVASK
jgi:pyruvate dehydrogenase complex dehydrogenase (E1) component